MFAAAAIGTCAAWALAQDAGSIPGPAAEPEMAGGEVSLWDLFRQSFDMFTVLLVIASVIAWTVIAMCLIEIREVTILRPKSEETIRQLGSAGQWGQVKQFVAEDRAFVSKVVRAAIGRTSDREAAREAGELAASEECARWFRKIEPLNIIGNLGPLLGLSGTVWGMVIAFAALGQAGGQASPASLSLGISKALFHTLLGLLVAVPALAVFGFYRAKVDRLCNRAMAVSSELVEMLPSGADARIPDGKPAGPRPPRPPPPGVRPGATGP